MDELENTDCKLLQAEVFKRLAHIYSGDDLLSELGSLLNLQKAAVYKRMNGDTMIKFDELVKIAIHFNFSLESVFNAKKEHISFQFDLMDNKIENYTDLFLYLQTIFDTFKNGIENTLIYSSKNLPFMHYMNYPILFELHMHIWKNTSFHHDENSRFTQANIRRLNTQELDILSVMAKEYHGQDTIEIWGPDILEDLYSHIRFAILANSINDFNYVKDVCSNIQLLINHLKVITEKGHKTQPGKSKGGSIMKVYINELALGSPMLYYASAAVTKTFLIHQSPNYINTYQSSFCNYTKNLLTNVMSYSTLISKEGTKDRTKYFVRVQNRFDKFKEEIYKIFEYAQL